MYYANDAAARNLGVRDLRKQISRKAYERQEIANSQLTEVSKVPFNIFKDPYLLDIFGLKENFLEADLEKAILTEIETFILEFGHGFTFVERQKRMTMGDDDFTLDLLFYHRILKRLVAVELKIGKFLPRYMGQMQFYLKWLNKYEKQEGENERISFVRCSHKSFLKRRNLSKSVHCSGEFQRKQLALQVPPPARAWRKEQSQGKKYCI
jgi:predicted nuclease of restriction endonuclease-like (RecB) superfamily